MKLSVFHLKNCDTCKKAIKALHDAGRHLTLIDVRQDGISHEDLARIESAVGFEALVNKSSTTWRGLGAHQKEDLTSTKALALMAEYPTLIKRPVIDDGKTITVGWKKDVETLRLG